MLTYLFLGLIVIVLSLINSKKLTILDMVFFIILTLVSGFRYQVGTDYAAYIRIINNIAQGMDTHGEIGFKFLTKLVTWFHLNSQGVILCMSILTMLFFYYGLKYYFNKIAIYKPVFYFLFILFPYFQSLNVIRQVLAGAIIFYGTRYIYERSFSKFMIYVLLAMSFHLSSMIFIPLYFLVNKNYKRVFLFSILILSIILSMSNSITNLFERIVYDLPYLDVGGYISKYLESRYIRREMDYGIVFFGNLSLLILSILWKDKLIDSQYKQVIFNLFYLYIISLILAGDFYALSRMQYFFSIYMVMFISSILDVLKVDTKRKIKPAFAIFYAFLFFYIIFRSNIVGNSNLMPYSINLNIFY